MQSPARGPSEKTRTCTSPCKELDTELMMCNPPSSISRRSHTGADWKSCPPRKACYSLDIKRPQEDTMVPLVLRIHLLQGTSALLVTFTHKCVWCIMPFPQRYPNLNFRERKVIKPWRLFYFPHLIIFCKIKEEELEWRFFTLVEHCSHFQGGIKILHIYCKNTTQWLAWFCIFFKNPFSVLFLAWMDLNPPP